MQSAVCNSVSANPTQFVHLWKCHKIGSHYLEWTEIVFEHIFSITAAIDFAYYAIKAIVKQELLANLANLSVR